MLEKDAVRASFQVLLSETAFRKKMRPILRKNGPVELRGGSRTARRIERDCMSVLWRYYLALLHPGSSIRIARSERGLGLFSQQGFDASLLPKELFGVVASLSEHDFDSLVESEYPSLYQTGGVSGILFGPMSLVNHSCGAHFRFSNLIPRGRPEGFDGFGIIRLKLKNHNFKSVSAGGEILVNYGMRKKNFDCHCDECLK